MNFPRRGEIYWVNLDPTVGTEISKTRPALIISNNVGNRYSDRVVVAPISSMGIQKVYPFEVLIPKGEGGLSRASKVLLDQIRSIDKVRIGNRIGVLPQVCVNEIDDAIRLSLDV